MSPKQKRFIQSWILNAVAVLVAVLIVPGIHFKDDNPGVRLLTALAGSLVLGILNAFIRPILQVLALPLIIFTLGLFKLVINGLILYLVGIVLQTRLQMDGFWPAFWGAVVIWIVSGMLSFITGINRTKIEIRRGPPPNSGPGGSGPVIDI